MKIDQPIRINGTKAMISRSTRAVSELNYKPVISRLNEKFEKAENNLKLPNINIQKISIEVRQNNKNESPPKNSRNQNQLKQFL